LECGALAPLCGLKFQISNEKLQIENELLMHVNFSFAIRNLKFENFGFQSGGKPPHSKLRRAHRDRMPVEIDLMAHQQRHVDDQRGEEHDDESRGLDPIRRVSVARGTLNQKSVRLVPFATTIGLLQ